ncbi:MAG TPA: PilZ domain-containing protein [Thermodesulfovibrionales bacterium]|nr:PilZ domain-containing protein [Thermodesulfovibrionales bacterium]
MSIEEKRRYERRPFVRTIKYYLTAPHMEELKKIEFDAISVDISEGGLGMITDYPFVPGDMLFFKDEIKVNDFVAKSSTVRWAREIEENRCRVGLEFVR